MHALRHLLVGLVVLVGIGNEAAAQNPALARWEAPSPDEEEAEPSDRRFSAKFSGGAAMRGVFDLPVVGLDIEIALGAKLNHRDFFIDGTLGYVRAESFVGLDFHRPAAGVTFEWEFDRWRVGLGPQLALAIVPRVSGGETMISPGIGAEALGSVDLYRGEWGDGLAGAARLMWEIEQHENAAGRDMDGIRRLPRG